MGDKTTYIIKDIDKKTWKKFRAKCILSGYNSAAECLREMIDGYVGKSK